MEKVNVLDLDNDVLTIIGDYVKADNIERMEKEEKQKQKLKLFQFVDEEMKHIRKEARKENRTVRRCDARMCIYQCVSSFYKNNIDNEFYKDQKQFDKLNEMFEEYLTLKKLNLKKK